MSAEEQFTSVMSAILRRWHRQQGEPAPGEARCADFASGLLGLISERGLPRPLAADEHGAPGSMSEAEGAPLIERLVTTTDHPLLREAARQLVKACFYPEFKDCRDSFRQTTSDGTCRRQELVRARERLSGSHCVDCPHWVALDAGHHERFLAAAWCTGPQEFVRNRDIFLPEDFRALRQWLWSEARRAGPKLT